MPHSSPPEELRRSTGGGASRSDQPECSSPTSTAYLCRVRLEQAHGQTRDATPGDGITVIAVAARWGSTPSRFTERYRAAHGVLPGSTLRT